MLMLIWASRLPIEMNYCWMPIRIKARFTELWTAAYSYCCIPIELNPIGHEIGIRIRIGNLRLFYNFSALIGNHLTHGRHFLISSHIYLMVLHFSRQLNRFWAVKKCANQTPNSRHLFVFPPTNDTHTHTRTHTVPLSVKGDRFLSRGCTHTMKCALPFYSNQKTSAVVAVAVNAGAILCFHFFFHHSRYNNKKQKLFCLSRRKQSLAALRIALCAFENAPKWKVGRKKHRTFWKLDESEAIAQSVTQKE